MGQHILNRGIRLIELLKQNQYQPLPVIFQIILIYLGMSGFLDKFDLSKIKIIEERILALLNSIPDSFDLSFINFKLFFIVQALRINNLEFTPQMLDYLSVYFRKYLNNF